MMMLPRSLTAATIVCIGMTWGFSSAEEPKKDKPAPKKSAAAPKKPAPTFIKDEDLAWPPALPDGQKVITIKDEGFLKPTDTKRDGIEIAKTPPTVDFMFYPEQNYPGVPWSNWGDGCVANGKYYSAIGDHRYIGGKGSAEYGRGHAFVTEYDPQTKNLRILCDTNKLISLPDDHYMPSKIHSRVDMGSDGWLYFATHRGAPHAAADKNHYLGDWIFRTHPETGKSEIVAHAPVAKHSIPNSVLDSKRMIFYGGTAAGPDAEQKGIQFLAYDVKNRKVLFQGPDGPARYMILAQSTGRLYYVPGNVEDRLMRYDPASNEPPVQLETEIGVRAATQETADGLVYTISAPVDGNSNVWEFNTKTEKARQIGTSAVGKAAYVASVDVDPTGRFLYYAGGAHGDGIVDGAPLVQFDTRTGKKKVIAYLAVPFREKYQIDLRGTYSTAISAEGDIVYVTWNISRGSKAWDCCGLTVVHIPREER